MKDNQSAITIVHNPVAHARSKHTRYPISHIQEAVQESIINSCCCPRDETNADNFTKCLAKGQFENIEGKEQIYEVLSKGTV